MPEWEHTRHRGVLAPLYRDGCCDSGGPRDLAAVGLAHSLTSIRSCRYPRDGVGDSEVDRRTAHVPSPRAARGRARAAGASQDLGRLGGLGSVRAGNAGCVWASRAQLCDLGARNVSTPRSPVTQGGQSPSVPADPHPSCSSQLWAPLTSPSKCPAGPRIWP